MILIFKFSNHQIFKLIYGCLIPNLKFLILYIVALHFVVKRFSVNS